MSDLCLSFEAWIFMYKSEDRIEELFEATSVSNPDPVTLFGMTAASLFALKSGVLDICDIIDPGFGSDAMEGKDVDDE